MKEIPERLDFLIVLKFCFVKNNRRIRRQATDWKKVFPKDTSDKRLLSKIYKELLKFSNKKTNDSIKR